MSFIPATILQVAITDDHAIFRKSLKLLVGTFVNTEVVLDAGSGQELLEKLKGNSNIHVLLLDVQMPDMCGFETAQKVKALYPGIKILMLTHLEAQSSIQKAKEAGLHGFYTKNIKPEVLEEAIWQLEHGRFYTEDCLTERTALTGEKPQEEGKVNFTKMELEIIKLTAQGVKPKQIANGLCISIKTVNAHKHNIQQKYGFDTMMDAVVYCLQKKIIDITAFKTRK